MATAVLVANQSPEIWESIFLNVPGIAFSALYERSFWEKKGLNSVQTLMLESYTLVV